MCRFIYQWMLFHVLIDPSIGKFSLFGSYTEHSRLCGGVGQSGALY